MQIVRTVIWVVIVAAIMLFSAFNWDAVEVTLWEGLVLETKVPVLVIVSFLLGLIPMWMLHRGVKWQLNRRISSLENAARNAALARHEPKPAAPASPAAQSAPASDALKPASE
ncbi:DUF1049 domain-containing protein [Altererythrobacter lutimaris]|uniref:DUF1049 domain-containing protein n=1 Tax=Altererythrobacter lutimaris TaxID=2743979 RepID=A0A850HB83_9SPHN|nr:DUF1049 domain-containing protein [Altererythrobacter lutimaris]NVE93788.1 DUF1049 domain-containing protein [Altererythrobacter lutimaris]